jgi:ribosomal-protein-alanine N-acetyltransferase
VSATGWPVQLREATPAGELVLRPPRWSDGRAWVQARRGQEAYLRPWEAVVPGAASGRTVPGAWDPRQTTSVHGLMVSSLRRQARAGTALPFAMTLGGRYAGMLTVAPLTRAAAWSGQLGYWVAQRYSRQGVASTAVALATDHCFRVVGLHRMEALVRPENAASRKVLERLGFQPEGLARHALFVDGAWRDHIQYAVVAGDVPGGILNRWRALRDTPV